MGDRANVVIKDGDEAVCLYTHWNGTELPEVLRKAMTRGQQRWDDSSYLARIIFCDMVEGEERELTGFGISVTPPDGRDRIIDVDIAAQTVKFPRRDPVSFQEFVAGNVGW